MPEPITTWFDLIRHGEPEGGPLFRGSKDDPLSDKGWSQMHAAIQSTDCWDAVLSSPLQRCLRFAEAIAKREQIPLYEDKRLQEIGFGEWEGQTAEAIEKHYGERLSLFWQDPEANPPPGGELLSMFQCRTLAAWSEWRDRLAGKRVLLVGHGGTIRVILGEVFGTLRERTFSAIDVPYASRSRVRLDQSEHGLLSCLVSHGLR